VLATHMVSKLLRMLQVEGNVPVSALLERSKDIRPVNEDHAAGSGPVKLLDAMLTRFREGKKAHWSGIAPASPR
jgi:hypothetical protein